MDGWYERFRAAERDLAALQARADKAEGVIKAARAIRRGCDCEYDHRCSNCNRVVDLMAALKEYDK